MKKIKELIISILPCPFCFTMKNIKLIEDTVNERSSGVSIIEKNKELSLVQHKVRLITKDNNVNEVFYKESNKIEIISNRKALIYALTIPFVALSSLIFAFLGLLGYTAKGVIVLLLVSVIVATITRIKNKMMALVGFGILNVVIISFVFYNFNLTSLSLGMYVSLFWLVLESILGILLMDEMKSGMCVIDNKKYLTIWK